MPPRRSFVSPRELKPKNGLPAKQGFRGSIKQKGNMKHLLIFAAFMMLFSSAVCGQGNAFSFQGKLNDGTNPANGRYDLEFKLFDAVAGGTQIGPSVARPNTILINGVFSVVLDFGAQAFLNPNSIFIEIAVKPNGSPNALTILGPRQQLTVVPFASRSQNSTNADNSQNSLRLGGILASDYVTKIEGNTNYIRNDIQPQPSSNFNISGNGTINGNLSVGGNQSLVGNQTVAGISNLVTINASGNALQTPNARGFVKAMLKVGGTSIGSPPQIFQCYNGFTNNSVQPCGFSVVAAPGLIGVYNIYFGTNVFNSFVSVSAEYAPAGSNDNNVGVNYRFSNVDNTRIDVFTFLAGDSADTATANFTIILY
jgi:hypothetical protein